MCPPGRSNKDEFGIYTDCHIFTPVYYIFESITLIFSIMNLWALLKNAWTKRKANPKHIPDVHSWMLIGQSLAMFIYMIGRLATGDSYVDHNYFLNFFQGLVRGLVWTVHGYDSLVYLRVSKITQQFAGGEPSKREILGFLPRYEQYMYFMFCLFFSWEITLWTLITYVPQKFGITAFVVTLSFFGCSGLIGLQYMVISLRRNLRRVDHKGNDYKDVEAKLVAYRNITWLSASIALPTNLCLLIPQVGRNSYWLTNFYNLVTMLSARELVVKRKIGEHELHVKEEKVQLTGIPQTPLSPDVSTHQGLSSSHLSSSHLSSSPLKEPSRPSQTEPEEGGDAYVV